MDKGIATLVIDQYWIERPQDVDNMEIGDESKRYAFLEDGKPRKEIDLFYCIY